MYLVDTSVWIDLYRQRNTPAAVQLREILDHDIPFGISSLVLQELLQGAADTTEFELLNDYFASQTFFHPREPVRSHIEAGRIYFSCRRKGITLRSTVDCLIARIAIEHKLRLLHNDSDFVRIAEVIPELTLA